MRLTVAAPTPGVRSSERCTRPLQAAQVIPETGMVQVALAADIAHCRRVAGVVDRSRELIGSDPGFVVSKLGPAEAHRFDRDTGKSGEGLIDGADAVVATHARDGEICAGHGADHR